MGLELNDSKYIWARERPPASTRSKRRNGDPGRQHWGHHVRQRDRVLAQDTALKVAAEEKSTPETLTTACHAASWLARS